MPPTGTPLSYEEVQLLEWWINEGASSEMSLIDIKPNSKIQTLLFKITLLIYGKSHGTKW